MTMLHAATAIRHCRLTLPLHTATSHRRFALLVQHDAASSPPQLNDAAASRRCCITMPMLYAAAASCRRYFTLPLLQLEDASRNRYFTPPILHAAAASQNCFTLLLDTVTSACSFSLMLLS